MTTIFPDNPTARLAFYVYAALAQRREKRSNGKKAGNKACSMDMTATNIGVRQLSIFYQDVDGDSLKK
jgi:hypothetical protein